MDQSLDTVDLKDPMVLFRYEGKVVTLHLFLFSLCSSTMTKDHFLVTSYGTKWPLYVDILFNTLIHTYLRTLSTVFSQRILNLNIVLMEGMNTVLCHFQQLMSYRHISLGFVPSCFSVAEAL